MTVELESRLFLDKKSSLYTQSQQQGPRDGAAGVALYTTQLQLGPRDGAGGAFGEGGGVWEEIRTQSRKGPKGLRCEVRFHETPAEKQD